MTHSSESTTVITDNFLYVHYSYIDYEQSKVDKKLSYRSDSAHLTSLYRTVQKALRYVEPFKGMHINYCQC